MGKGRRPLDPSGNRSPRTTQTASTPPDRLQHWMRCGMDVMEAIYERRAVRAYTGRKLEPALIHALLRAAVRAPSAMNLQPWSFLVLQDPGLLQRLGERARQLTLASLEPGGARSELRAELEDPSFDLFHGAGTLIVLCAKPGPWPGNEDCCLAGQNLMLAAHGLGLGTCPIGLARAALNEPATKLELGVPAEHAAVLPVAVGHPRGQTPHTPRREPCIVTWR